MNTVVRPWFHFHLHSVQIPHDIQCKVLSILTIVSLRRIQFLIEVTLAHIPGGYNNWAHKAKIDYSWKIIIKWEYVYCFHISIVFIGNVLLILIIPSQFISIVRNRYLWVTYTLSYKKIECLYHVSSRYGVIIVYQRSVVRVPKKSLHQKIEHYLSEGKLPEV